MVCKLLEVFLLTARNPSKRHLHVRNRAFLRLRLYSHFFHRFSSIFSMTHGSVRQISKNDLLKVPTTSNLLP